MNPARKALWFIESHLAHELTLDDISDVAGISRFHMVRAFAAATGLSVMRYVRARRLSEAARALASGAPDILVLALEADYGSHEAFTRAFRDHFGVTPEAVRGLKRLDNLRLQEPIVMDSTIIDNLQAPRFQTGKPLLIAGLGERITWESGAGIPRTVNTIWNHWLPAAGLKAADAPNFERYDENFNPLTGDGGLEIWIPVRECERDVIGNAKRLIRRSSISRCRS